MYRDVCHCLLPECLWTAVWPITPIKKTTCFWTDCFCPWVICVKMCIIFFYVHNNIHQQLTQMKSLSKFKSWVIFCYFLISIQYLRYKLEIRKTEKWQRSVESWKVWLQTNFPPFMNIFPLFAFPVFSFIHNTYRCYTSGWLGKHMQKLNRMLKGLQPSTHM